MFDTLRFIVAHPLNRHRRFRAVMGYLRWQLIARIAKGSPLVHRWIADVRFHVRLGETGLTGNVYCGLHEFHDMAFLIHALRPDDLFVDVGANAGSYTLLASGMNRARSIALEPDAETFSRLKVNLALNGLAGLVMPSCVGAGDHTGRCTFTSGLDTVNHVILDEPDMVGVQIEMRRLDDVVESARPVLIKIDVEGFEWQVLRGAQRCLEGSGPMAILIELNGSGARYGIHDDQVTGLLHDAGFQAHDYDPIARSLLPRSVPHTTGNTLFLRDRRFFSQRVTTAPPFAVHGLQL